MKKIVLVGLVVALSLGLGGIAYSQSSDAVVFDKQTNDENSVKVEVMPVALFAGSPATFEISISTHSVNLDYDMLEISTLQDSEGKIYKATEWKGSPPGGHHRKGILRFPELEKTPQSVKLVIRGIANVPERSFEWKIGSKAE